MIDREGRRGEERRKSLIGGKSEGRNRQVERRTGRQAGRRVGVLIVALHIMLFYGVNGGTGSGGRSVYETLLFLL